jgi:hypothetical protein
MASHKPHWEKQAQPERPAVQKCLKAARLPNVHDAGPDHNPCREQKGRDRYPQRVRRNCRQQLSRAGGSPSRRRRAPPRAGRPAASPSTQGCQRTSPTAETEGRRGREKRRALSVRRPERWRRHASSWCGRRILRRRERRRHAWALNVEAESRWCGGRARGSVLPGSSRAALATGDFPVTCAPTFKV